jgi:hypothetical protein
VAVGRVKEGKPGEEVHSTHLSYFSRMLEAASFTEQASAELLRRGIDQVEQVCAAMDGAEWIDGFLDWLCPDVLRILDFPHAGEYVDAIGKLAQAEGFVLPEDWLSTQLHKLKHAGPAEVLEELRQLRQRHPHIEEIAKKLAYLEKREARMQYQEYQAQGWPIASGIVESGNKVVMQARLKGAGMHWAPVHVNPLLALRCGAWSDRWDETYEQAHIHHQKQRVVSRDERRHRRYSQHLQCLHVLLLMYKWRSSRPEPLATGAGSPPAKHSEALSSPDTSITAVAVSPPEKRSEPLRPSATHPWRRRLLAKK